MSTPDTTPLRHRYWAKARPASDAARQWHPFLWHALDVAACAESLMARHEALAGRMAALAGGADLGRLVTALAVLHDMGKLSRFQGKAPEVLASLRPGEALPGRQTIHHAHVGLLIWKQVAPTTWEELLETLVPGVFGHHGFPAYADDEMLSKTLRDEASAADVDAARALARFALDGFFGDFDTLLEAPLGDVPERARKRLSFLLAAVLNIADWLGSNQDRFPYEPPDHDPETYWRRIARPRAAEAVARSGVIPARPAAATRFADLFPEIAAPRPLQAQAETLDVPQGQGLILVEDVTGSGKTEAADVLAARMMAAGLGRGVYIALPTAATAERMAARHRDTCARLFDGATPPSLTLVHATGGGAGAGVLEAGEDEARAWLSGERRRQLAADVAVGTVDQALLAALPARYASARLFGLAAKVLVVDEVHAHDDYTGGLLCGLLRLHAALGGSAILLSATLTAALKGRLAGAFADGAGWRAPPAEPFATTAYPAITVIDREGARVQPVRHTDTAERRVAVHCTEDTEAAQAHLLARARAGGCALWMRNTVDDAIEAYDALKAEHADVTLIHARFPAARRRELEADVERRFGRKSGRRERAGAIVVATQVLEQSLDLDFDAMVADLKPIDALIQTAGRLHRHARDAGGTRTHGEDGRGSPVLWVHGPRFDPAPDADWYRQRLPRAVPVYPRIDWLWRTAEQLATRGELRQPAALRDLIEAGLAESDVPEGIEAAATHAKGEAMAACGYARGNVLSPQPGYACTDGQWSDDARVPTRLGESLEVCLLRAEPDGTLHPWDGDDHGNGFLRVRTSLLQPAERVQAMLQGEPRLASVPDRRMLRWRVPLPLMRDAQAEAWVWTPRAPDAATAFLTIRYDRERGLQVHRDTGA